MSSNVVVVVHEIAYYVVILTRDIHPDLKFGQGGHLIIQ